MKKEYTWEEFYAFDFPIREGVKAFWETGYNYNDPGFWDYYPDVNPKFAKAVQIYDWLRHQEEDEADSDSPKLFII